MPSDADGRWPGCSPPRSTTSGDDLAGHRAGGRIVAVVGDLGEPGLGLSEEDFDTLARTVDVIHHPGGRVNFIYPYSHMAPANVDGTREIIRMAARYRNIPVHYTSTMAVVAGFGTAGVRHVDEDTPLAHADHLSVGYVESKWVAEALLLAAAEQGLPVAIYRAADISGDQENGAWNTATEMCAMKKFVVDTGTAPIAELPLDYTPVDVLRGRGRAHRRDVTAGRRGLPPHQPRQGQHRGAGRTGFGRTARDPRGVLERVDRRDGARSRWSSRTTR